MRKLRKDEVSRKSSLGLVHKGAGLGTSAALTSVHPTPIPKPCSKRVRLRKPIPVSPWLGAALGVACGFLGAVASMS